MLLTCPPLAVAFVLAMSSGSKDDSAAGVPRIDSVTEVASTRWLSLKTLSYTDQEGKERKWDVTTRTTKRSPGEADAVVIVPLLRREGAGQSGNKDGVDTLLVEQYRPPVGRVTTEFPAGLIDDGESPEDAALRELREETGYVGEKCKTVPQVSREVCMSPGLTDESVHIVVVEVNLDNPYNHGTPKPDLDDGEHVVVRRVGLDAGLKAVLDNPKSGMPIEGLYLFSLGLELGKQML